MAGKRELIDTGTDKRYVRRNPKGRFKESDDVGRSLAADRRKKQKTFPRLVRATRAIGGSPAKLLTGRRHGRHGRSAFGLLYPSMCGRVIQAKGPIKYALVDGLNVRDSRLDNYPRRWNACPSQDLLVIRQNPKTGERSLDLLKWGLIPYWCEDPKGGRKPINAKSETVARLPMFRDGYRLRRCILPVDGFYEWMATKGGKQPYAIAMKDRSPFGIAGIWENWKSPEGEWVRTFALLTTPANELVGRIHDRMPAILKPEDYERWLGPEPDPGNCWRHSRPSP